jgi:hypothetical protein
VAGRRVSGIGLARGTLAGMTSNVDPVPLRADQVQVGDVLADGRNVQDVTCSLRSGVTLLLLSPSGASSENFDPYQIVHVRP